VEMVVQKIIFDSNHISLSLFVVELSSKNLY
jgi:hypothetical protein